jgi:hypothetical protein
MADLVTRFGWLNVVVIHDGSTWGVESAAAFSASFRQAVSGGTVLNADATAFSLAAWSNGTLNVTSVLDEIARACGRIVYAALHPRMMGAVFAAFDALVRQRSHPWYTDRGDFAWLLGWVSNDIFSNAVSEPPRRTHDACFEYIRTRLFTTLPLSLLIHSCTRPALHSQDGSVNVAAVRGAEGSLGALEATDSSTPQYQRYLQLWSDSIDFQSTGACDTGVASAAQPSMPYCSTRNGQCVFRRQAPYCDADGHTATLAAYAAQSVDAVLLYAQAIHFLHLSSGTYLHDTAQVYATMKQLSSPQGVSSPTIQLDASGDRLGRLTLLNLQVLTTPPQGSATSPPLASIPLNLSRAEYVAFGVFDTARGVATISGDVRFASGQATPSDGDRCSEVALYVGYNASSNECAECVDRWLCARTIVFTRTTQGHSLYSNCDLPNAVSVPCSHVEFESRAASWFRTCAIGTILTLAYVLYLLIRFYRSNRMTAHVGARALTRPLLLALAASVMASAPVYHAGFHNDRRCAGRWMLTTHTSVLTMVGLSFTSPMRDYSDPGLTGHCRSLMTILAVASYLVAIICWACDPTHASSRTSSYFVESTHQWHQAGGMLTVQSDVCDDTFTQQWWSAMGALAITSALLLHALVAIPSAVSITLRGGLRGLCWSEPFANFITLVAAGLYAGLPAFVTARTDSTLSAYVAASSTGLVAAFCIALFQIAVPAAYARNYIKYSVRLRWVADGSLVQLQALPAPFCYHLFLSHVWGAGNQEKVQTKLWSKSRCTEETGQ